MLRIENGYYQKDVRMAASLQATTTDGTRDSINQSETIALIDFLNLARKNISGRDKAKFTDIDEFIASIKTIAHEVRALGDFSKIYLVTKSFNFNEEISYTDIPLVIMWSFCKAIPEWTNRICLVLVNGINDKDREADDRALFVLYKEYCRTTTMQAIIFSNDNFESLRSHYLRKVTLNFYSAETIEETWRDSKINCNFQQQFQNDQTECNYVVVSPDSNLKTLIAVS